MKRRQFIKGIAAASAGLILPISYAKQNADVIVIGAGLAGLSAAYNLKMAGLNVQLLEGDDRIGGRVKTLSHIATNPEAGGMQIGQGYGYMRALAQQLNVPLAPLSGFMRGNTFAINHQLISAQAWPSHVQNKLNAEEKKLLPSQLYFHYLKKFPKLTIANDWTLPKYAHLDRSMQSLLTELGASEQALALINANVNANNLAELSGADAVHVLTQMMSGGGGADRVVNGNSKFINAMAAQLSPVELNKSVTQIKTTNTGVQVNCKDGSSYSAKHCICTIPFSVLRHIDIQANINAVQRAAIKQLNYTAITQVHFEVSDDSWLEDGLPANMWSNGDLGRIFASKGDNGSVQHLVSWINGDAAKKLDTLSKQNAMAHIHKALIKQRPSLTNKIKPVYLQSWGNNPFSQGAYSSFAPNQVQQFAGKMGESAGNLHFAGEHTNHDYNGMESALVSGLNAASQVIQKA
ncbi:flavin monoamine oxidase family protein [Pseudocolwellia agarivorans]|uniref:flavin monoamine oxidase family protein n=1 Tax=Pseudocolwellia agarivorans TaxID=1911682 RepID=UPI000986B14A|nr:NAD(P)/FAD-dependent oxidoreductase [Pseudocolwellia agarivorans]